MTSDQERGYAGETLAALTDLLFGESAGVISDSILAKASADGVSVSVTSEAMVFRLALRDRELPERTGEASFSVPLPLRGYFLEPRAATEVVTNFLAELMEDIESPGPVQNVLAWE